MKVSGMFSRTWRVALLALCAATLAGCGTLSGHSQSCSSTGGLLFESASTCEGTADTLGGRMGIEFGEGDGDRGTFDREYRLEVSVSVEEGEAEVYAPGVGGEELSLGTVSAGKPLTADGIVELSEDSDVFSLDAGEDGEVKGLSYTGTITRL